MMKIGRERRKLDDCNSNALEMNLEGFSMKGERKHVSKTKEYEN